MRVRRPPRRPRGAPPGRPGRPPARLPLGHEGRPPALAPGAGLARRDAHYGLGIYDEPIYVWVGAPKGRSPGQCRVAAAACLVWPEAGAGSVTRSLSGADFRLCRCPTGGSPYRRREPDRAGSRGERTRHLRAPGRAGASGRDLLASLLIGLSSAEPVELAHRRQLEFTADASHELRTPLSVIEASLSLAHSSAGTDESATLGRIAPRASA